ncbi:MAG: hypothetical protein SFV32_09395 [Opitutaceae bacterium]|nr:hypothetical protein [Opitutaceae bacterium]
MTPTSPRPITRNLFRREPKNPIVVPGGPEWRRAVTFNPGVVQGADGRFYLFERAAGNLRPFICTIGLHVSDDGVTFRLAQETPVFTPEMCGSRYGSVQDPRVVFLEGRWWMTFAYRPFAWSSHPTATGVPESHETDFPGVVRAPVDEGNTGSSNVKGGRPDNFTRSGLAVSDDLVSWSFHSWITAPDLDDRDVILFPEKVGGRYAVLRRPLQLVGERHGTSAPSIWISFSDDLLTWTAPELVVAPVHAWEGSRIGASTPPLRTDHGWLVLHHGVEVTDAASKHVVYRLGALLLDLEDPRKVLARTPHAIMEPETYYERFGAYIPDVIFPTANVIVDGTLYLYYGVCDTAIALAYAKMDEVIDDLLQHRL